MAQEINPQPIKGKIVGATTLEAGGVASDSISVEFAQGGIKQTAEFVSPYLNAENMKMWRKVVMSVVWNQKILDTDPSLNGFENYRKELLNAQVFIVWHPEHGIYGIGKKSDQLFFPDAYGISNDAE